MRIEKDSIGELEIPADALYGINALRSNKNFPVTDEKVNPYLIHAYLQVKLASARTNRSCDLLPEEKFKFVEKAIENLLEKSSNAFLGDSKSIYDKIIVDPLQGGAGTSLNMNVNEVIANSALLLMGNKPGDYDVIHPLDDINLSQSTNDTYPSALKIAGITLLRELADSFAELQRTLQSKEEEFKNIIKLGRTQFQDAVPITLGQEFGTFAQAIARETGGDYIMQRNV